VKVGIKIVTMQSFEKQFAAIRRPPYYVLLPSCFVDSKEMHLFSRSYLALYPAADTHRRLAGLDATIACDRCDWQGRSGNRNSTDWHRHKIRFATFAVPNSNIEWKAWTGIKVNKTTTRCQGLVVWQRKKGSLDVASRFKFRQDAARKPLVSRDRRHGRCGLAPFWLQRKVRSSHPMKDLLKCLR